MVERLQCFIGGQWLDSRTGTYMPITDASTGTVVAEAPCCTADEVNRAIASAHEAFGPWAATPVSRRTELMFRFRALVDEHIDELSRTVAVEIGKNLDEARGSVIKVLEVVDLACACPVLMQGDSLMNVSTGFDTVMYRQPLGVFGAIVPFNFPAMIPFGWILPLCITTGNTLVLKASSQTPLTSVKLLRLLVQAGLPPGVVNLITCSRREAGILLEHPFVRGITYVGSTSVGKHIYSTAAAHGKRVQALCEAKNHGLVMRDANLDATARTIINSSFGCAGQRCMALPVVCVEEPVADDFVSLLVDYAKRRKVGCAYAPDTELGPVVSAEHKQSVISWIERGIAEGATLVLDGRDVVVPGYEGGFFLGPTIFDHVLPGMTIGDEEVFGPVVTVKRVSDFEHGLEVMNANRFANGSTIFTESGKYAREFAYRTHAGMVGVNVGIPVPTSVFPFSGHKESFFGDLHVMGKDGVAFYTEAKCVTTQWFGSGAGKEKISTWEGTIARTR